jgi:LAO/AO transport system kinase
VGQSEIEIAGLADVTVVVLVPEAGDEVQTMKAGLMEVADVFVVNKADRPGADLFVKNLRLMLAASFKEHSFDIPVIKTVATEKNGVTDLWKRIDAYLQSDHYNNRKAWLLTEKAWDLIEKKRMKGLSKRSLQEKIELELNTNRFNLYAFINSY